MSGQIQIGNLPPVGIMVSIANGKVVAQVGLHDLALSLRDLAADCDRQEDGGGFTAEALALRSVADVLEDWRRVAIGEWMDRNKS
jgi:hypothetical protein